MSGQPAGGGASILGESHHPPSLKAGRSTALTYGEEKRYETHHCIIREPLKQWVAPRRLPACLICAQLSFTDTCYAQTLT